MPLVYLGACSHAPGITARAERADTQTRQALEQDGQRHLEFDGLAGGHRAAQGRPWASRLRPASPRRSRHRHARGDG